MTVVYALAGAGVVLLVLAETFEVMVLPRRVTRPYRFSRVYYQVAWAAWRTAAGRLPPGRRRATVLSVFGPLSLLTLFTLWAGGLAVGFGLLHHATAPPGRPFADDLYLSGVTFTTLGYGDVTPAGTVGRALAVAEAGLGFGFLAVVIGYLPVLYQAFSRREAFISRLDARAGSPPTAGQLLLRLAPGGGPLDRGLDAAEQWASELLESHLSFPILGYYRSQHDNQSWLAALVCVLDTAALLLTVVDAADRAQVRMTFAMARHALVDLALVLRRPPEYRVNRLPAEQLAKFAAALRAGGVRVRADDRAEAALAELRGLYEPFAAALAEHLALELPPVCRDDGPPDNWQTSAWMRQAGGLTALGADPRDDHFD